MPSIERVNGRVTVQPLPTIEADATQMRQLFQNLISNALTFHRSGVAPEVDVRGERIDVNGRDLLEIHITDNASVLSHKTVNGFLASFNGCTAVMPMKAPVSV